MNEAAFAKVLEARRGYFNARFAEAQVTRPDLDGDAFSSVLGEKVAPVVEAVARYKPDTAGAAGQALYDIALDLFGQGLLVTEANRRQENTSARAFKTLDDVWRELLPALAPFLAEQPQRVAASVVNAAYNLAQTPHARPQEWIVIMYVLATLCKDADTLLRAGQVAAWRSGMAQYRSDALEVLKTLDAPVARTIFGLRADAAEPTTEQLHDALAADPWYVPGADDRLQMTDHRPQTTDSRQTAGKGEIRIMRRVGAFRGFGGTFIKPPEVRWTDQGFVASDEEGDYLLMADAFGATLHRTAGMKKERSRSAFRLDASGQVTVNGVSGMFPELANATSWAGNLTTLAVTTELCHSVFLVAAV